MQNVYPAKIQPRTARSCSWGEPGLDVARVDVLQQRPHALHVPGLRRGRERRLRARREGPGPVGLRQVLEEQAQRRRVPGLRLRVDRENNNFGNRADVWW